MANAIQYDGTGIEADAYTATFAAVRPFLPYQEAHEIAVAAAMTAKACQGLTADDLANPARPLKIKYDWAREISSRTT